MSNEQPPDGFEYVWVSTNELQGGDRWVVLSEPTSIYLCRGGGGCKNRPVAKLNRSHTTRPRWWFYCADHLFGKRIVDGQMQTRVLREVSE
jgi:hypothetical protein